ncbi:MULTISPECIES: glycosyltransferase [unclassified Roseitalea]|uniref:glycosyltransferase n=1 Tax=unclassified Roseitalea TaxID=2639107 RepID=UPI00273E91C6|nr:MULTISPECIES: glycosyltransferase [unclassified Roseitalea]
MKEMFTDVELTSDRPLVTFALFAYNQERYIRDAIEGAFAQTYEPLEIILSDDCSTDRTFEVMQEMASEYQGPHNVRVRRSELNLGTALHLQAVALCSNGAIVVVAAGDDISVAIRTEKIVNAWKKHSEKPACIHSGAILFDESKRAEKVLRQPRFKSILGERNRIEFAKRDRLPFLSPTCAYAKDIFLRFDSIMGGGIIEDGVLALRSLLSGDVVSLEEPLVYIRRQRETSGTGNVARGSVRWNRFILSRISSYTNKIHDASRANISLSDRLYLEKKFIKRVRRLALFLISPSTAQGATWKLRFLIKYLAIYPSSAPAPYLIADGLAIIGQKETRLYRFGKAAFSSMKRT